MSIPERTGRVMEGRSCRWCGPRVETVIYEVRDPETGSHGDEVMCCTCGKSQWRWLIAAEYWEGKEQWDREFHQEVMRNVAVTVWLAARLIQLSEQPVPQPRPVPHDAADTTQLDLFGQAVAR
ncbi:hypothetical protein [Streptomyces sp. NPDC005970]|uniref:hypothetical protein n=1 Tax=Streptomyces sp. NPDC005970 TaxID=3156723 RepID=UPI0033CA5815